MKFAFAICLAAVATIIATGCNRDRVQEEYLNGQGQAEADLAKGEFKIAFDDGTIMPEFYDYTELLHKRYNVDWCSESLPANPQAAMAWVRGYNEVAGPRVERKIGAQVLKETRLEAQKLRAAANTNR